MNEREALVARLREIMLNKYGVDLDDADIAALTAPQQEPVDSGPMKLLDSALEGLSNEQDAGWSPAAQSHLRRAISAKNMINDALTAPQPDGVVVPRSPAECYKEVRRQFNLDCTDPFTRTLAALFAMQDSLGETKAALERCQNEVHRLAAAKEPGQA